MVGRVLRAMNKEIRVLHEAAYLLAGFTFLSQVLALVRDRVFAHTFGAGSVLDAYFTAFKIPDITFAFLTLFVWSFALVPLLAEKGGPHSDASRRLLGSLLLVFGAISIVAAGVLFIATPWLVESFFGHLPSAVRENIVVLSRVMLLQPLLLGVSSIIASIVQASKKFFLYALAPIFYNVGIIIGATFFYSSMGVVGLAWGVVLGAVLHLGVQFIPLFLHEYSYIPIFSLNHIKEVAQVMRLSLPRALTLTINQVLFFFLIAIASLAALGSVSVFSFAFNLQSVPLSIIGVSYAAALFPSLALLYARGDHATFSKEVWAAVRHVVLWITPAIALMVVLRAHIVRVILGSGEFTWADTRLTAAILAGFVISLIAQAVILIFSRAYYAAGKTLEPVLISFGGAVVAVVSSFIAVEWFKGATLTRYFIEDLFRVANIPGTEVVVIALVYSLVMTVSALLFGFLYARRFGFEKSVMTSFLLSFAASVFGASAAYLTLQIFGPLLPTETFFGIFIQGFVAGVVGILVWALMHTVLKSRDFLEVASILYRLILGTHKP